MVYARPRPLSRARLFSGPACTSKTADAQRHADTASIRILLGIGCWLGEAPDGPTAARRNPAARQFHLLERKVGRQNQALSRVTT